MSLLGFKESNQMYDVYIYNNDPENCTNSSDIQILKTQKQFNQVEEAGSEITNIDVSTVVHARHAKIMIRLK